MASMYDVKSHCESVWNSAVIVN